MSDLVAIARKRDDRISTHWEGCEEQHTECLIRKMADEIERLRGLLRAVTIPPAPIPEGFVIDELRKTITALHVDIARIREAGRKDYEGMREFQRKFIDADHEIDRLRHLATQRGARMQIMRDWLLAARSRGSCSWDGWDGFVEDHPESADWFDEGGENV